MRLSCPLLFIATIWVLGSDNAVAPLAQLTAVEIKIQESSEEQAFSVLRDKCKVCHNIKKKTDIFTFINMVAGLIGWPATYQLIQ